jgi:exodeoxyribonuclease V gamma subunit
LFHVLQSNRIELLASACARTMRETPLAPLESETILVPSTGLGRWLAFVLARELGVAANVRFAFAAGFIWTLVRRLVPSLPEQSLLEPEVLRWRIARLLAAPRRSHDFDRVNHYLESADTAKRFDLASAVADAFDRYLVYRPDWIDTWASGGRVGLGVDEGWQGALWQSIAGELPEVMRVDPRKQFFAALASGDAARAKLPRRVQVFAVAALPPAYLDFLRRLADDGGVDVRFYALNPSREYWGDIVRRRERARAQATRPDEAALLDVGNGLLASLGWHGRALFDALAEFDFEGREAFLPPARQTLLASLQSDILELTETPGEVGDDDSLRVHVCHSATREVEVLHDRLLDLFERDATLRPSDILVLVPQLDAYAPAIEAVFAAAPPGRRMPFAIADRPPEAESDVARAFRLLIALSRSRLEAESVLSLLEIPCVARRFGIASDDLATVRQWLLDTGVRWGRDERSREALGLPATREHTWRAGFERLLLGYALVGDDATLFAGVLPYEDIEGGTAALAGRLKTFADAAFALAEDLQRARSATAWRDRLDRVLADFFSPDEDEAPERQSLRDALVAVADQAARGGNDEEVPLAVIERALAASAQSRSRAFLGGGVTFASLAPGRPVPARVVAVLGMNDGAFPHLGRAPGFDLVAKYPRRGDRDRRDEDRYAFVEVLLSARERLHLSYTGRSVRDNEPIPPSTVVSEVVEAVRRGFGAEAVGNVVVEHPLQPFSRRYFDGSDAKLFSYADSYAKGPRGVGAPTAFLTAPVAVPEDDARAPVTLHELERFLRDPAQALVRGRMGIWLAESEGVLDAAEPFALDALELSAVRRNAFNAFMAGASMDEALAIERARGTLPQGEAGRALFAREGPAVAALAAKARMLGESDALPVDHPVATGRLIGSVRAGPVFHPGKLNAARRIISWVRHLAAQLAAGPTSTVVYGLDGSIGFAPVEDAAERLGALVALYRRGRSERVPLFPRASFAYASRAGKDEGAALAAARSEWEGNAFGGAAGERDDAYVALAWRGVADPLDAAFRTLAVDMLGPMVVSARKGPA